MTAAICTKHQITEAPLFVRRVGDCDKLYRLLSCPNTPGLQNILTLLDDFTISGPNGTHKVLVTEVVMPLRDLSRMLSVCMKKEVVRGLARGLAHVHHRGFVHGDIHKGNVGCAMPPRFAEEQIAETMSVLFRYDMTIVIPENPALDGPSLPPYRLSPCDLLDVYRTFGGLKVPQDARLYDFGNARREGEKDGTDDVRWASPPPEAAFAYHGCGGLEALPTMVGDIWCPGALIVRLFTGQSILYDTSRACLLEQAKFDGVIPAAWRNYWDSVAYLRDRSGMEQCPNMFFDIPLRPSTHCYSTLYADTDQVTPENAAVEWSKRRESFVRKNPDVDAAEVDLLISLLRRMLATEPETRPSADEVLAHAWFVVASVTEAAHGTSRGLPSGPNMAER